MTLPKLKQTKMHQGLSLELQTTNAGQDPCAKSEEGGQMITLNGIGKTVIKTHHSSKLNMHVVISRVNTKTYTQNIVQILKRR